MVIRWRTISVPVLMFMAFGASAHVAEAHPLHTTLTEVSEDRAHGTVRAVIRVFADDFGTAVTKSATKTAATGDAAAMAYVSRAFSFTDRSGHPLALTSCGTKRTSDLLWICVEAPSKDGLAPLRVKSAVLCDLFDDQINVVQGTVAGARKSVLFTRGDAAKPLSF